MQLRDQFGRFVRAFLGKSDQCQTDKLGTGVDTFLPFDECSDFSREVVQPIQL
ncbi:MAG: hypothetical protein KDA80_01800 [Planctomycetaceae bacterium]|nr:hypothetical protein [Planctomycetaceae bacterium]